MTEKKKYAVYLDAAKADALEAASEEDKRTYTAIFEIGLDMYLGSRNNWRVDEQGGTTRQLPND